ncbi:MAG: hypothetical protein QGI68_01880 [Pseudomonadales bacterium]|jgi:hypothetical protein|nr:hypothetical protein [Pseudomonadales bacterium]MDP7145681.1 hypothetical protein [Pseudomonadales bacterium]MDP7360817.1 hypothetical protein [Pseudomonadales bacterium]MDP7594303.1 hypothetical protein [Pseudomonadales bacterium]HJN52992.1 hypothetical protein [Pseudomonadales bacterium]|tara:strand:- start:73 stop:1014 length:942 start_codon:yes stop_codon:yes gene_type:complete
MKAILFVQLLVISLAGSAAEDFAGPVRLIGNVEHAPINEMSGIVKSRRFDGVYWVHNDSGDAARIFAVNRTGKVIIPQYVQQSFYGETVQAGKEVWPGLEILLAANQDWEDIAVDDEYIYIADAGNNGNARRDMGVYILYEPNPRQILSSRILKYLPIRYPEQQEYPAKVWHYDNEGMFFWNDRLYFLSKHRKPGQIAGWEAGAVLYRLDTEHIDRVNLLERVDDNQDITLATGADVSPNGAKLAILSYTALWLFDQPRRGDKWLSGQAYKLDINLAHTKQAEAVCWDDDDTLLITNEGGEIFEVKIADIPAL